MSLLKTIRAQLGLSNTPAENHFFDGSVANQLTLKKGTPDAQGADVMTVDSAGKVAFPQNAQTWQDVTGSRTVGTTYINNTGQPIQVVARQISQSGMAAGVTLTLDSLAVGRGYSPAWAGNSTVNVASGIVPAGSSYSVTIDSAGMTFIWLELR